MVDRRIPTGSPHFTFLLDYAHLLVSRRDDSLDLLHRISPPPYPASTPSFSRHHCNRQYLDIYPLHGVLHPLSSRRWERVLAHAQGIPEIPDQG